MPDLNTPTAHQIDEFVSTLKAHDWFYDYSDDRQTWIAGREQANKISAKALSHEIYGRIYRMWKETIMERAKFTDVIAHRKEFVDAIKADVCATIH